MTKKGLIEALAVKNGTSRAAAERSLEAVLAVIGDSLATDGEVRLTGIGKLYVADCGERKARNPRTGEDVMVPARKRLRFKASKSIDLAPELAGEDGAEGWDEAFAAPDAE